MTPSHSQFRSRFYLVIHHLVIYQFFAHHLENPLRRYSVATNVRKLISLNHSITNNLSLCLVKLFLVVVFDYLIFQPLRFGQIKYNPIEPLVFRPCQL